MYRYSKIFAYVITLFCFLSTTSCSQSPDTDIVQDEKLFVNGKTYFELGALPQSITVGLTTNTDYDFEISYEENHTEDWITPANSSTSNSHIHIFNIAENETLADRLATIRFVTINNGAQASVKIFQKSRAQFKFYYTGDEFRLPTFAGTDVGGFINWEDGDNEDYCESMVHHYDSSDEHCITATLENVESVKLDNIKGISLIDLSAL